MTKADLVVEMAEKTNMTKKDAGACLDALLEIIQDALVAGDKVQLTGFGVFEVKERSARKGRNPQTGEEIDIAAKKVPAFRAGKVLKDAVS